MPSRPAPPAAQLVTSSDLVRHFGLWQERATRAPLYILHRGRPRFVLASIETMDALCEPHNPAIPGALDPVALLDGVSDLVVTADETGSIVAASRSARAHFGAVAAPGGPVEAIAPVSARPFVADTIRRVIDTGCPERIEIPSATRASRMLGFDIAPMRRGVALFGRDGSMAEDHARARAAGQAQVEAMAAAEVAAVTVNLRGRIVDTAPAFAALTGLTCAALLTIRFAALAEITTRVALGEAIERTLADGIAHALDVSLLVNRADPVPVRIGLAPSREGTAIAGAVAVVRPR